MRMVIIAVRVEVDKKFTSREIVVDASQIESIEKHDTAYHNYKCNICMRSGKKYASYDAYRVVIRQLHEACPSQWFGHLIKE